MDLVDEQERALPLRTARARGVEDLFQFRHAGMDRRELHECVVAGSADEARDRRLAAARRPPEDHRAERGRREQARQRPIRSGQMLLARNLCQRHRPQSLGKRRRRRLGLRAHAVEKAHGTLCLAPAPRCPAERAPACRLPARSPLFALPFKTRSRLMSSFGLSYAPSETLGFIPERLARLTAMMARKVEEKKAPGVSMLIARHGSIVYRESVGALRPGGPAMTEDAIFRIYSMTKPIVSVAAMMLVEEGRLLITDHGPGPDAAHIGADLWLHGGIKGAGAGRGLRRGESEENTGRACRGARRPAVDASTGRGLGI